MRKLIGTTRSKKKLITASNNFAPRRHTADDDMEEYSSRTNTPRTPNGAVDLISGGDEEDAVPPRHNSFHSKTMFDENEEGYGEEPSPGENIYARLDSFEEKMESELQDLEQYGVSSSGSEGSGGMTSNNKKAKGRDPDGKGGRARAPLATVLSIQASAADKFAARTALFKRGEGKNAKNLQMLSGKTSKIMSEYQAYLSEIQNAFSDDEDNDGDVEEMKNDPAFMSVQKMRDDIRGMYDDQQLSVVSEDSSEENIPSAVPVERNVNYANGGGKPFYRAFSLHERNTKNNGASTHGEQGWRSMQICGGTREKYAQPWLRSKKAKRGIISMVVLAIVALIGSLIVGGGSKQKAESLPASLPDLKEEYIAEVEKAEIEERGTDTILGQKVLNPLPYSGDDERLASKSYQAAMKFRPVMYDRSQGWSGRTYPEALVFCEVTAGLAICPYEAVCPNGIDSEPVGGYREASSGDWSWMPILDGHNQWVQIGRKARCVQYKDMHGESPKWGTTGSGAQYITENVMCCLNVM
mmetsp:Transcript_112/g.231  ORF Transcript_112/g.231 Transcript_112/m.231 type:complete len:525 (+) Transcript_112:62-1636(+)